MQVDEPFAEYVAARWSMLYRLAVLLVGEEAADELTQAVLVDGYLTWAEVQEAPSADDHLKRRLARAATRLAAEPAAQDADQPQGDSTPEAPPTPADGTPSDAPSARSQVGAWFAALPPRQRVIAVLRDYEVLSDAEIGTVLGCSPAVVAEDVTGWGALDRTGLREELITRAEYAEVPLPPTAALVAQGRAARRRRTGRRVRWTVFAALVVVTGLALASVVQGMTSGGSGPRANLPPLPRSVGDLPKGHAPRIGYTDGTTLHLAGGRKVALIDLPTALATTRSGMYVALPPGRIVRVDFDNGTAQIVTDSAAGQLISDPGGNHVAWLTTGAGKAWVTVGDVGPAGGALLDQGHRVPTDTCCYDSVVLNGMTGSGQLVVSVPEQGVAYSWDTGRSPAPGADALFRDLTGLGNGVVSQVTAGEVVGQYGASHFAAGALKDGTFLVNYEINARGADFADPLGERVVYVDDAGETHVLERRTHGHPRTPENVRLQLPLLPGGWTHLRWEDADHVLLDVVDDSAPRGALVRCDVHTGGCAVALRFTGPHLLAG